MQALKFNNFGDMILAFLVTSTIIIAVTVHASVSFASKPLRIGGTGASTGMTRVVGAVYSQQAGASSIEVLEGLGSGGGIKAVAAGVVDISFSSRALKKKEHGKGIVASPILRTPFVAVTSHSNSGGLRRVEFANYYGRADARWADGLRVKVILRPKTESDTKLMASFFPGMSEAIMAARDRDEVPIAHTDQDNAMMAEVTPGALTSGTLLQMLAEKRQLRILPIDGIKPTVETMMSGKYPYYKTLYIVHAEKPSPDVAKFIAFLRSPAGIAELSKLGAAPVP